MLRVVVLAPAARQRLAAVSTGAASPAGRRRRCRSIASPGWGRCLVGTAGWWPASVDIRRYPLQVLAADNGVGEGEDAEVLRGLLARCRADVAAAGYCQLPGFVRHESIAAFIDELAKVEAAGFGFRSHEAHNVYLEDSPGSVLAGQATPRNMAGGAGDEVSVREKTFASSKVLLAMDTLGEGSPLLEVYRWEPLRMFFQAVFDLPQLFRSADPLGGVYYNIFDGAHADALGWHFDRSHFSMNLILQTTPGAGGDFQYLPDSRDAIDTATTWPEVQSLIARGAETPELLPGSLYLFAGNRSLHRVSPVTAGRRANAIFTFVEEEGARLNEYTLLKFFGRTGPRE